MTSLLKRVTVGFLIAMAGFSGTAAAAQGFFCRYSQVRGHTTDSWRVQSGRSFDVTVRGDGDTDLDLFVYDAVTGELLGVDDDESDYCVVTGYSRSGQIVVPIKNLGSVYNEYRLTVR